MDELARAKQQYFKLMRLVSKNNELHFLVSGEKLFAVIGLKQRVLLCEIERDSWKPGNVTDLFDLEEFLAKFLNHQKIKDDKLTDKIRLALFGHSS